MPAASGDMVAGGEVDPPPHLPHARRAPPRGHHHTDARAWRRGHSAVYARPPSFVSLPPSACRRSRARAHLRRLRRRRWAARLGVHRLFMVFVANSADPARGSRQTPSSCVIAADVIPCSFEASARSKMCDRASKRPLPAMRCAYTVSIYNLEAVEISVCSKHSAGGKWPQPWTAGRTVISNAATLELFLQIHKFCHNDHLCDSHGFGCQWRILFASQSRTMYLTRFGIVLRRVRHGLGQGFDSCRPHLEASHLSFFAFFLLKTQRGP